MTKKKNGLVIAIDGPSGAGKSTAARLLALRLGYVYIDTGAMYRAIGWKTKREGIDPADERRLADLCRSTEVTIGLDGHEPRFYVDGTDVSGEIRTPEMGMMASAVSKSRAVRERLLVLQRELGKNGGVVMDGRDIGTVVFPRAEAKFYLDASLAERARRRLLDFKAQGLKISRSQMEKEIRERDRRDTNRKHSPLKKATDAVYIDTSKKSISQVL